MHRSRRGCWPGLLDGVGTNYGLTWDGEPRDCGGVNLNVHIPTTGDGHVIRVYAPWTSQERLAAIQSVRASLFAAGRLDRWREGFHSTTSVR